MEPRDLFVSHSSDDSAVARELRQDLEAAGYSCWMAPDDILGTETWTEQILTAITACRAMLVLVSSASNRSPHVAREVNLALGRRRPVLPVRIEAVAPEGPLEYLLSLVQRVDAYPLPIHSHRDLIVRRVEATLRAAGARPTPGNPGEGAPTPTPARQAPSPDRPLGPGSVIGSFTVEAILGQGGMATVYRARQAEPRRAVALKVIRADHAADDNYRRRFLEEKDTLATLEHPSIVPIFAAGQADGHLYIAMRLVNGASLQQKIERQGPLSLAEVVRILEPIADAIDYAHQAGIVHRDLKPSNIILDEGDRPYLTDFGLGKRVVGGAQLSDPGLAIGTLAYMAPEQFNPGAGPALTPALDIYALACVAYTCFAGAAAYADLAPERVMYQKLREPAPGIRARRPDLPPAVETVLARGMAQDPGARQPTALTLVRQLETLLTGGAHPNTQDTHVIDLRADSPVAAIAAWVRGHTAAAVLGSALLLVGAVTVIAALGGMTGRDGPGSSPSTSTGLVTPGPTPGPTVAPSPTPTAASSAAFPNADETALLALLPSGYGTAGTCMRYTDKYTRATAMVYCPAPAGTAAAGSAAAAAVFYALFPSADEVKLQFDALVQAAAVNPGGKCSEVIPANNPWSYGSPSPNAGDLACYARGDAVQFIWTHTRVRVLASWLAPTRAAGNDLWAKWATAVGR